MQKVPWFERLLAFTFPTSLIEGTPWMGIWKEKERQDFLSIARVFFPIAAAIYLGHFFFYDKAMNLEPEELWLKFRVGMATLALLTFAFYMSSWTRIKYYRLPAALTCLCFCYFQGRVTIWYDEAPWLYCFVFTIMCTMVLKTSVLNSVLYAALTIAVQWNSILEAGVPVPTAASASFVTLIFLIASRGNYLGDVRYFLLNQQNIDAQRKNIELNIEFTDRIKSFIPEQIAKRLENHLNNRETTVLQAIDEVLRPRKREVACLFSDIRGFTEASKELEEYIGELVLPNVKECTSAIEANGGIPRKIGDLVFAYFDDKRPFANLLNAISAGFEISKINETQNSVRSGTQIQRYILIATGDAIVGNIGGFDSSVEITALGSPVNFLSRVDEITKQPSVKSLLSSGDLILCKTTMQKLVDQDVHLEVRDIRLDSLGLTIRNFSDEKILYCVSPSESNVKTITSAVMRLNDGNTDQAWNERAGEAA